MNRPKILFVWPPKIEDITSTFRHIVCFGETAGYFSEKPEYEVKIMDGGVLLYHLKDFALEFTKDYDAIAMHIEPNNIEAGINTVSLAKDISPRTKVIAFGTAPCLNSEFLMREGKFEILKRDNRHRKIKSVIYGVSSTRP